MANDFLFTWKPEHWPYEKLRNLIDRFEAGEQPQELWRCGAQRQFREQLLVAYGGKCCVTNCEISELLEAAHIVPYRGDDTNRVDNGLLLRSDIHTLFDCGLITVDHRALKIQVSERLRPTGYWKLNSKPLRAPTSHHDRPSSAALKFHCESWRSR
jgi:predicted restriction endonuclease